jgi:DNA polymerase-3 subunit gamma/tau
MSHQALARKWRPQRFDDVIGQRGVVETLKNAITTGRLAQAFIFAGPRGVGKTTTARILARALNCVNGPTPEPCGKCDPCVEIAEGRDIDVFEIDGATYTGVDAVREVIVEPLGMAPMRDRFKIFIIDEVHRLSKSAFDALLKSIEEPPPYVKFMMATTELRTVPVTIQSRSQTFELRTLPFSSIRSQLKKIAADEQVKIDDAALALVARSAEGSMRDALSALDQVLAFTSETVSADDVSVVLGLIGRDLQFDIVETIARDDVAAIFGLAGKVVEAGFDLRIVCRELARLTRDLLVVKIDPTRLADPEIASEGERDRLTALAERFSREDLMRAFDLLAGAEEGIKASSQPRHHFEMALVKWIHLGQLTSLSEVIANLEGGRPLATGLKRQPASEPKPPLASEPKPQPASPRPQPAASTVERSEPKPETSQTSDPKSAILSAIRETHKVFFGMVVQRAQSVELEGDSLVFTFAPAHKTVRPQLEAKRGMIEQLAQQTVGRKITLVGRESASAPAAAPVATPPGGNKADLKARAKSEPSVQAVLDVFGGEIEDVEEI